MSWVAHCVREALGDGPSARRVAPNIRLPAQGAEEVQDPPIEQEVLQNPTCRPTGAGGSEPRTREPSIDRPGGGVGAAGQVAAPPPCP